MWDQILQGAQASALNYHTYVSRGGVQGSAFFFFFFSFLRPHLWHMEVPRLGVKQELAAYTTATPDQAASATYTTAHSNVRSFNPLRRARDQTHILMDTS